MSVYTMTSWNVNSLNVRQPQVLAYLAAQRPDVLGLQELKQTDDAVRRQPFFDAGWCIETYGQKTYNGVALISQKPLANVVRGFPGIADTQARAIAGSLEGIRILNVYVPNGKSVGDEKYLYKLDWLAQLYEYVLAIRQHHDQLVIMGDFNIAPAAIDVHDPDKWQDKILCSTPERDALQRLCTLGLRDAYRTCYPSTQMFSWWDYRQGGLRRNIGLRIDLTLVSEALEILDAAIDLAPRQQERPSDHAPVSVRVGV